MSGGRTASFVAILCAVLVTGCGGGGGGGSTPAPPPPPQPQTIAFAQAGPVSGVAGSTVTNAATGGGGTGAITYSSSNVAIATVNGTSGVATLVAVGTTTITASKAASDGYLAASASYTLNV